MKIRNTVSGTKIVKFFDILLEVPVGTRWLSIDDKGFVCAHFESAEPQMEFCVDNRIWFQYETGTGSTVYGAEVAVIEPFTFEVSDDKAVHLFPVEY